MRFLGAHFLEKGTFAYLPPPKQMSVLTISNENIFCKTQGTKLSVIIEPIKVLEQAPIDY